MKSFVINYPTNSALVESQDFFGAHDQHGGDILVRIKSDNQFKTANVTSTSTQTVRNGLNAYLVRHVKELDLLNSVILWQKKTIDFQALHTAFLLNSISEDDFEHEAEKFTVRQKKIPPEVIASIIESLSSLTKLDLDTSDYADYFQCSQENVMEGLRLLPYAHFVSMLPSSSKKE